MKLHHILIVCMLPILTACHRTESKPMASASFEELSQRGYSLCRSGNYTEGLTLLLAANDSLRTMHPDSINPEGVVMLLGNISNLYTRMGLYEEAKQTSSEAIAIAEAKYPWRLPDLWRMRGELYNYANEPDSQLICLHRSVDLCEGITDSIFHSNAVRHSRRCFATFFLEHPDYAPDSIPMVLKYFEKHSVTAYDKALCGISHILLGNYSCGLPMLEAAVDSLRRRGDTEGVEWGLQILAKSYAESKNPKLFDIYKKAAFAHDSINLARRDDMLLGMDFKYRTSQLKRETAMLQSELTAKHQRIIFIVVIAVLIVGGLVSFGIMHGRNNRQQLKLKQQNIDTLLAERIALNTRIEKLNQALDKDGTGDIQRETLPAILLEKEDEKRFRKSFNDLYPGFVDRLRHEYPELTAGNELLCMLIALRRRNEEIALALGISRESVVTSRYRLRSRFNLPKEVELNDFIQSKL